MQVCVCGGKFQGSGCELRVVQQGEGEEGQASMHESDVKGGRSSPKFPYDRGRNDDQHGQAKF